VVGAIIAATLAGIGAAKIATRNTVEETRATPVVALQAIIVRGV
jgi:hypothetical protein